VEGANFAERFNREARALARLNHPNIVAVYEFGHVEGLHFFLMEYVDGANLRQLEKAARLAPREALQLIPQICDALQYAHDEGVVHRDIKPENVLVDRKGRVKIADFGLAKILGRDAESLRLTDEGQVMGTPHYMAPEQVARPLTVDHRADIYSLGVVLYEMLTGDLPIGKFPPPSSHARALQVDIRFDEVVLRALENDPERRYQNASEVKTQVETIAGGTAPAAAPPADSARPPATGRKYLYWGRFPVVVEYGDEREISWNGTLSATSAALLSVLLGILILRVVFGLPISSLVIPLQMAILVVVWGVRRTLNQPWADELPRTPQGTVILPSKNWRQSVWFPYLLIPVFTVAWTLFQVHWLTPQLRQWQNRKTPAQIVTVNPETGRYTTQLPGGGIVELLAVANDGATPNQWWQPNGQVITNAAYELHNVTPLQQEGRSSMRILVKHTGLNQGAEGPYFDVEQGMSFSSGGKVFVNGQPEESIHQACFTWPADKNRATVRVGYGLDAWRTVSVHDVANHRNTYTAQSHDPQWGITVHDATDGNDGAQLTLIMGERHADWHTRVVAVDMQGMERTQHIMSGNPSGRGSIVTYAFPGMRLKEVTEFRVQARLIHWMEFSQVALKPNSSLPAAEPLRFSEVIETAVTNHFDFDTGEQWSPIPTEKGRANRKPDAFTAYGELRVSDMAFATVTDSEWSTLTPQQVIDKVYQGRFAPRTLKPLNPGGSGATFVYQTRENGFGILQFVQAYPAQPGVAIHYKRVERPWAPSVPKPSPVVQSENQPTKAPVSSVTQLTEPPQLRFLAWQDEWQTNKPYGAWYKDGSPVVAESDLQLLRHQDAVKVSSSPIMTTQGPARFLHLWISHPLFDKASHASVTIFTTNGQRLRFGDFARKSTGMQVAGNGTDVSWFRTAFSPGPASLIPERVDLRFDYTIGPVEQIQEVDAKQAVTVGLKGNSKIKEIEQTSQGSAIIKLDVDVQKTKDYRFVVIAVMTDGLELESTGGGFDSPFNTPVRTDIYFFDVPLAEISRFKIGTRPVRTVEWKNVPLPPKGPQP